MQLPWPEDQPLNWDAVMDYYFKDIPDQRPEFFKLAFAPAFKPLSTLGVDAIPDLMQFLPAPDAPDFPSKAIGLMVLLDQGGRVLFAGTNKRYVGDYFDVLSQRLAHALFALPPHLRPDSTARLMQQGWSWEYALAASIWLVAPFVHSEHLADQEAHLAWCEGVRREIEERVGRKNPHRATAEEDDKDIYAFPRMLRALPDVSGMRVDDFMFWIFKVFRVHAPIIRKFGRYPSGNGARGRISTEEELQYAKDTDYFGVMKDKDLIKQIREDVEAGRWTPFKDQPAPEQ